MATLSNTPTTDLLKPEARPQPGWLTTLRREATERIAAFPPLGGREEAWRYTDLSLLAADQYAAAVEPTPLPEEADGHWLRYHDGPAHAASVDGHPTAGSLGAEAARAGVTLQTLARAARTQPELLRKHLGGLVGADDLFTARSLAAAEQGLFLHVPRGARLTEPLRLQHWIQTPGALLQPRLVVVVEADAELVLEDDLAGAALQQPSLVAPVTEIYVGRGARVSWQSWQDLGPATRHLAHVTARLAAEAELTTFTATFGADFSRTELRVEHAGEGARSALLSAYFPTADQHMEHWTVQDLQAPHARSELLYKGVLGGESHAVYYGTIRVGSEARGTDSYQTNRNLLLSPTARADSNPQLEIDTNDVRCSHGSSVSQVEDDQLFYAMARGIGRAEAERLLITGFLAEVADRLPGDEARSRLEQRVAEKLSEERP